MLLDRLIVNYKYEKRSFVGVLEQPLVLAQLGEYEETRDFWQVDTDDRSFVFLEAIRSKDGVSAKI